MMLSFLIYNRGLAVIHRLYSIIFINNLVTRQTIIKINYLLIKITLQQFMEAERQLKQVILCDLEKHIDLKTLTHYLTTTKALEGIKKITKNGQNFLLVFENQKEAQQYINKTSFKEKIIKKYINLYFSIFNDRQSSFQAIQLTLVPNQLIRKCFQVCSGYGVCKFTIKYDSQKRLNKIIVSYLNSLNRLSLERILQQLQILQIKAQIIEENSQKFKCSIELINFEKIQDIQLSKQVVISIKSSLQNLIKKISPKLIKSIQIKSFMHNQNTPYVKAYFRYSTIEDTFEVFKNLKKYILDSQSSMKCKIYFFQNQSNSYRTLFTNGLLKQQQLSQQEFQNILLEDFRKINQNVVQICLKWNPGNIYTAKIYLKDQQSGKSMIGTYQTKRQFIYKHYKDKGRITINIFQDKKAMNEIRKLQKNTFKMFENFDNARERNRQSIKSITPQYLPYYNQPKKRQNNGFQREKERQRQKMPRYKKKQESQKKCIKYIPKQEDFPSI